MDSLLIVMGGSLIAAILFYLWMAHTKSGQRWFNSL